MYELSSGRDVEPDDVGAVLTFVQLAGARSEPVNHQTARDRPILDVDGEACVKPAILPDMPNSVIRHSIRGSMK
jgi:hypothetical protein